MRDRCPHVCHPAEHVHRRVLGLELEWPNQLTRRRHAVQRDRGGRLSHVRAAPCGWPRRVLGRPEHAAAHHAVSRHRGGVGTHVRAAGSGRHGRVLGRQLGRPVRSAGQRRLLFGHRRRELSHMRARRARIDRLLGRKRPRAARGAKRQLHRRLVAPRRAHVRAKRRDRRRGLLGPR